MLGDAVAPGFDARIATFRGKRIEDMTREELIEAVHVLAMFIPTAVLRPSTDTPPQRDT